MARACLHGPWHLLLCGAWNLLAEGNGMELPVPCWPQLPAAPTAAPEPAELLLLPWAGAHHTNDYLSLGALPGIPQHRGTRGRAAPLLTNSSARCCSLHSPQGNQTLWIFWSFVVKLFPNSNRFKYHRTNGREKRFMQLQGGFLRWLSY